MRVALKKTVAASLAALALSLSIVGSAPASAHSWSHGGFHGRHGYWGPGVAFGVVGLAAGAIAASQYDCAGSRPIYDRWGNYVGEQPVNLCQ